MSAAETIHTAAKKFRAGGLTHPALAEPFALWLEHEAAWAEHFLANEHPLAVSYVVNAIAGGWTR